MCATTTPAATPAAEIASPTEQVVAPPTIDSHGGKLTPMTCWGCGPDGISSSLMILALLAAVAPRGLEIRGRVLDLTAVRLAPGLLLTAIVAWNRLPPLRANPELLQRFPVYASSATMLGLALLGDAFLHLVSDALMPLNRPSRSRSLAAMIAAGLAVLALPIIGSFDIFAMMDTQTTHFDPAVIIAGYLGIPVGVALLLLWRRFDGRLFDVLVIGGGIGSFFVVGMLLPDQMNGYIWLNLVAFTVAATLGAGLRGLGLAPWQGLTGRAAWIWSWVVRICMFTALAASTTF